MKKQNMMLRMPVWLGFYLALVTSLQLHAEEITRPAPPCNLTSLQNSQAVTLDQFKGKVVYVDFWASWCTSCAKSFPFLNTLQENFKDKDLRIIGVNLDDESAAAQEFLTNHPANFMIAADTTKQCANSFAVEAMPSTYLIDKKGNIRYAHLGFRESETADLQAKIKELLLEP